MTKRWMAGNLLLVSVARVSTFFLWGCKLADERFLLTNHHVWVIITLLSWNQHCNESINLASKFCSPLRRMFTFFPSSNRYLFCSAFYSSGTVTLDKSKIIVTKSGLFEWKSEITQVLEIPWTDTKKTLSAPHLWKSNDWTKCNVQFGKMEPRQSTSSQAVVTEKCIETSCTYKSRSLKVSIYININIYNITPSILI